MVLKFITWDVEHGSAAYIRTPNSKHIAIDLGARRATDAGFSPLAHLRKSWGVQQLDLVVITHPHLDHIEDIPNFRAFSPKVLMRPSHLTESDIWGNNRKASPENTLDHPGVHQHQPRLQPADIPFDQAKFTRKLWWRVSQVLRAQEGT